MSHKARRIAVVAGGYSFGEYPRADFLGAFLSHPIIGVNDSAVNLPCDEVASMDRVWIEGRLPRLVASGYLPEQLHFRKGVVKNLPLPAGTKEYVCDHKEHKPTLREGHCNGTNSGTFAVNLALQLALRRGIKDVYLFGFDFRVGPNHEKHWYPSDPIPTADGGTKPNGTTKPGTFRGWAYQFEDIQWSFQKQGVRLINVNHRSNILALPQFSFREFLDDVYAKEYP